jgi:hypothetical protein
MTLRAQDYTELILEWLAIPEVYLLLGVLVLVALFIALGHSEDD